MASRDQEARAMHAELSSRFEVQTSSSTNMMAEKRDLIIQCIRTFQDFPTKGIPFKDICPILKNPEALTAVTDLFEEYVRNTHPHVDLIVGLDARGFLFGPLLAQRLGVGFALVRKKGKLPGPTLSVSYSLEYGQAEAEMQEDAVSPGQKVLIIDDLLATGGTLYAACELVKQQRAEVLSCLVVVELKSLNGADKLKQTSVFSIVQY
nr:adenine phosphoribosyltransferase [Misgurnus anguillicaudatus]